MDIKYAWCGGGTGHWAEGLVKWRIISHLNSIPFSISIVVHSLHPPQIFSGSLQFAIFVIAQPWMQMKCKGSSAYIAGKLNKKWSVVLYIMVFNEYLMHFE